MDGGGFGGLGTWRRYKLGQTQFTNWLKQTSEKLATRPQPPDQTTAGGASVAATSTETGEVSKPCGKKRKGKKTIGLADSDASSASVHWSQLETMATTIVEHANPVDIPEAPINILRDVVGLRKKSARFFSSVAQKRQDESMLARNATHEHIINVLERVLDKFEGMVSHIRGKETKPSGNVDINDLSNMFEHLEVEDSRAGPEEEDDAEQDSQAESPPTPGGSKKPKKRLFKKKKGGKTRKPNRPNNRTPAGNSRNRAGPSQAERERNWVEDIHFGNDEDEDDQFDYYMMVYCFFEDFNTIRNYIRERWCDYYYDGSVSLNTLAIITNAACEFFRQIEHDLSRMLRGFVESALMSDYKVMTDMLFFEFGIEHIDYDSYDGLDKDEADERIYNHEADWLALATYWDINNILHHIPPGKVPTVPPSAKKQPSDLYGASRAVDRRELIHRLMTEYMLEAATVKALKKNGFENHIIPAETETLIASQSMLFIKSISSQFVFSLHLYADVRAILEHKVEDAFLAMQETAKWVNRTIEKQKANATGPRSRMMRDLNHWQKDVQHYMLEDFTLVDKEHRFESMHIDEPVPKFALHKCDPVWTGLLDFRAKLITNHLGHRFASRVPLIEAAAYIHCAAKAAATRNGTALPAWPDMEKFMDTYSDDSQFKLGILQAPNSAFAILNNWENMMAILVSTDRESAVSDKTLAGRKLAQSYGIRTSLLKRYELEEFDVHKRRRTTLDYCHEIILHRLEIDMDKYESQANMDRIRAAAAERGGPPISRTALAIEGAGEEPLLVAPVKIDAAKEKELRRKAMLAQLSPLEVLKILDETVTSLLDGVLSLDYFQLFDESIALLQAVSKAYGPGFQARVGEASTEPDHLVKIPCLIAEDLKASAAENPSGAPTLGVLVETVRAYLDGKTGPESQ